MDVSSIGGVSEVTKATGGNVLGKEEFMTLLLKQLSYQDPPEPDG